MPRGRMCNLYSELTTTQALERLRAEWQDAMRNVPPFYAIYPDYTAPIVRQAAAGRSISLARWGLPSLKDPIADKPNRGTANIRHPWFDNWKGCLGVENRCLVPINRSAEPTKLDDGSSGNASFALDESEPLTFFAGLRTSWHGTRDLQRPQPNGILQVIAKLPLKYVPGLAEIPDPGDPLRLPMSVPTQSNLL